MVGLIRRYLYARAGSILSLSAFFFFSYLFPVLFFEWAPRLTSEDGLVANTGSACLLLSTVFFILACRKALLLYKSNKHYPTLNLLWLTGLACIAFLALGEEISWGQRLIGFETPDVIKSRNMQGEFNLHNLEFFHGIKRDGLAKVGFASWMTAHRIFYLVLVIYMLVLPIAQLFNNTLSKLVVNLGLPITPIWIGVILLVALGLAKTVQHIFAPEGDLHHSLVEIMEANVELILMLMSVAFFRNPRGERMNKR